IEAYDAIALSSFATSLTAHVAIAAPSSAPVADASSSASRARASPCAARSNPGSNGSTCVSRVSSRPAAAARALDSAACRAAPRGNPRELVVGAGQLAGGRLVGLRVDEALELLAHALVQLARIAPDVVNDRAQLAEAERRQPVLDHVERRALVAHEQHALTAREVIADDVRDRLRLARTRWAMDPGAARIPCEPHGARLARVGVRHEPLGLDVALDLRGLAERTIRTQEALDRAVGHVTVDERLEVAQQALVRHREQAEHGG